MFFNPFGTEFVYDFYATVLKHNNKVYKVQGQKWNKNFENTLKLPEVYMYSCLYIYLH